MRRGFYLKLAAENIRKNRQICAPFLIAGICAVKITYIMYALTQNSGLSKIKGGTDLQMILMLGSNIMAIFSAIFLFYTNSFLMKRRKKEFGVYNILGMEKKHIARVIFYETLDMALICIVPGMIAGVILNKLFVLLALRMMHTDVVLGFEISWGAMVITALLFCVIFALILIHNLVQVYRTKPVELLRGGNVGEKEPKTKGLMTVLGLISLGAGYFIAVTTKNPISALALFFVAVILVMIGTYLLFASGSIALLKWLRRRKQFYYQPKHFISVSGMIYRMKQNAVGLANICILSTGVLLLISVTVSLYAGTEDAIAQRYPNDMTLESEDYGQEKKAASENLIRGTAEKENMVLKEMEVYPLFSFAAFPAENGFEVRSVGESENSADSVNYLHFLTLEGLCSFTGQMETLEDNQILIIGPRGRNYEKERLEVLGFDFLVKDNLSEEQVEKLVGQSAAVVYDSWFIIVKDLKQLEALQEKEVSVYGEYASHIRMTYDVCFADGTPDEQQISYYDTLLEAFDQTDITINYSELKAENREFVWGMYSGFLFIGILLGLLFLLATVLIIYYKQISEGYEDKERYEILQKVGMSSSEIRHTIRTQILMVFFLPLLTAGIHLIAAFPMVKRMLALLMLSNKTLFVVCTVICFVVFSAVYAAIYGVTARCYYKIVSISSN